MLEPPQPRVRRAVHLPRELRRRVEMPRQGQVCVLVHWACAVRIAVYPHTARIEDARDVLRARRFEQHARPAVVDELGAGWVRDDVVDVRDRCEMHDRVAASDGPAHGVLLSPSTEIGAGSRPGAIETSRCSKRARWARAQVHVSGSGPSRCASTSRPSVSASTAARDAGSSASVPGDRSASGARPSRAAAASPGRPSSRERLRNAPYHPR